MVHNVSANGADIPSIGFGTWPMKGQECDGAVSAALETGYRHFDTAAMYGNEADVGAALNRGPVAREDLFVTTKVWPEKLHAGPLRQSVEESLRLLGMDYADLLLIHWPNPDIPIAETLTAMAKARSDGLVRHVGISNFTVALIEEAVATDIVPLVANQVEYHPLLDQTKVLAACRRHGMALTAYLPLARGRLMDEPVIQKIANERGRAPGQIILRWHIQQPNGIAIPKSATPTRIRENFAIYDFELSDDEMAAISGLARPDGRQVNMDIAPDWD